MTDTRNDLAKARDEWMLSNEGCRCLDGITSGPYLRNRLQSAFVAGWDAKEKQQAYVEMYEKTNVLCEIKTLSRILNTWGNAIAPSLNGKQVTCAQRLSHFVERAKNEFGMSLDDIEKAIA